MCSNLIDERRRKTKKRKQTTKHSDLCTLDRYCNQHSGPAVNESSLTESQVPTSYLSHCGEKTPTEAIEEGKVYWGSQFENTDHHVWQQKHMTAGHTAGRVRGQREQH